MRSTIITPVTTEPISLAQVKEQLKLDSGAFIDDITTYQSIAPGNKEPGAEEGEPPSREPNIITSDSVDVMLNIAVINLSVGTCLGALNVSIEHSDDNTEWEEFEAFDEVTDENDNEIYTKEYTGVKRYIRVVGVVTDDDCEYGVNIIVKTATTSEDSLLSSYITVARQYGENVTGHKFAPQTIDYYLDAFPSGEIEWPFGPLTNVTHIKYKNSSGTETTLAENTDFLIDKTTMPGRITTPYNINWPSFTPYPLNPIVIRGICGYTGTAPYLLPQNYKQAMLYHIGLMYSHRDTTISEEEMNALNKIYNTERVWWF